MKQLFSILFLFIALSVSATTYYIDPAGNDATGTGAIGAPWKTLYKACTSVTTSGNIIHVNPGIYTETVQSALSVGVSIEGSDTTTTIIKNSGVTAEFTEILRLYSASEGTDGNQHISGLQFDGNMTNYWGIYIGARSNVSIYNCSIKNFINRGAIFSGRTDNTDAPPTIYATGNSIYNSIISNCAEYDQVRGYGAGCVCIGGQTGFLLHDNTISQNSRACGHNGWPVKYHQGGYLKGLKIYNNTLNKIPNCYADGDNNWDFAIELFNEQGLEVYSNTINGGGIDMNHNTKTGYNYAIYIHDNTFAMPSINTNGIQPAITMEYETDSALIANNTVDKYTIGVLTVPRNGDTVQKVTVRNNLITDIGMAEGTGFGIQYNGGTNVFFNSINTYNNTILINGATPVDWGIWLPNVNSTGFSKNVRVINNIIKGASTSCVVYPGTSSIGIDSLTIVYNDFTGNGSNTPIFNGAAATHYALSNNLSTPPTFGTNYKLVSGTSLVDAGINVGLTYIGSAPDINYTDSTSPAPAVICNSWDSTYTGTGITLSNTNNTARKADAISAKTLGTTGVNSGKYFFQIIVDSLSTNSYNNFFGIANHAVDLYSASGTDNYYFNGIREVFSLGTNTGGITGADIVNGDTLGFAMDFTGSTGSVEVYVNRTSRGTPFTSIDKSVQWFPMVTGYINGFKVRANFQPTFLPSGYSVLCTANISPTAAAGTDQTTSSTTVTLTGSGTDSDGSIVSYAWTKTSGTGGTITSPSSSTTTVTGLSVGTYVFRLTVTDNLGATGYDEVTITITADGRYIKRNFVNLNP